MDGEGATVPTAAWRNDRVWTREVGMAKVQVLNLVQGLSLLSPRSFRALRRLRHGLRTHPCSTLSFAYCRRTRS